jgi:hypothetical protein
VVFSDRGKEMTHDELLAEIDSYAYVYKPKSALRAVVELHKPSKDKCWECSFPLDSIYVPYPCPTIQAIEKELK